MKHELVGGTLKRVGDGIVAECKCGWSSIHFSSLAASAAFQDHKEKRPSEEQVNGC